MSKSVPAVVAAATLVALAALTPAADARSRKPECAAGYQWTSDRPGFVPTYRDSSENGGTRASTKTFTVDVTKTIGRRVSKGAEAEAGGGFAFVHASVKAQFNVETAEEVTVKAGYSEAVTVPAGRRVVYRRGVNVRKLRGVILKPVPDDFVGPIKPIPGLPSDCRMQAVKTVTATIPTFGGSKITSTRIRRR